MNVDPITTEVIRNAYNSIAEDMSAVLNRSAYSPIIYEMHDYGVAIFNEKVQMLGQAPGLPYFTGGLEPAIKAVVQKYGLENLKEGDVFVVNDSFMVGAHLNDTDIISVYCDEGKPAGFGVVRTHWSDIGMADPGMPLGTTEIFQEGIRLPPTRIMSGGEWEKDIVDILCLNSRLPQSLKGDMGAQIAAARIGERRYLELIDRFGLDTIRQATINIFTTTETKFRAFVSSIPDGIYTAEGFNDNDSISEEPVFVKVTVTISGDEITIDTTGSNKQCRGNINSTIATTVTTAKLALALLYPSITPEVNHGSYTNLKVVAEPGSVFHAQEPAACMRPIPTMLMLDLIFKALSPAIPDNVTAGLPGDSWNVHFFGRHPDTGEFYVQGESLDGGWGASSQVDGVSSTTHSVAGDFRNCPTETMESRYPVLIRRLQLGKDSGGAGKFRGGLNVVKEYELLEDAEVDLHFDRAKMPQWGLFGGHDGIAPRVTVYPAGNGEPMEVLKLKKTLMKKGTRIVARTGGGGGFGDPNERHPDAIREDLSNGYISIEVARNIYGVDA